MTKRLIVLVGNIGTGKSTYCKNKFVNGEIIICPDNWDLTLSEGHRKLTYEIEKGFSSDKIVVIDGNNLKRKPREFYIYLANKFSYKVTIIDFGPGNDETLKRRINNPSDFSAEEWTIIHTQNMSDYEKPVLEEGFYDIATMY